MGVNSLPETVNRQRRDCDLNPGPTAPESSTPTTRLPSRGGRALEIRGCVEPVVDAAVRGAVGGEDDRLAGDRSSCSWPSARLSRDYRIM